MSCTFYDHALRVVKEPIGGYDGRAFCSAGASLMASRSGQASAQPTRPTMAIRYHRVLASRGPLAVPSAAWLEIQKLYTFEDGEELIRWLVFTS